MVRFKVYRLIIGLFCIILIGCGSTAESSGTRVASPKSPTLSVIPTSVVLTPESAEDFDFNTIEDETVFGYTYHRPDGNRFVDGTGNLLNSAPIDISLMNKPRWLVASPFREGSLWVVVFGDGHTQAFYVVGKHVESFSMRPATLPPGMPPVMEISGEWATLSMNPGPGFSEFTHPSPNHPTDGSISLIDETGDFVLWNGAEGNRLELDAMIDGRILGDG